MGAGCFRASAPRIPGARALPGLSAGNEFGGRPGPPRLVGGDHPQHGGGLGFDQRAGARVRLPAERAAVCRPEIEHSRPPGSQPPAAAGAKLPQPQAIGPLQHLGPVQRRSRPGQPGLRAVRPGLADPFLSFGFTGFPGRADPHCSSRLPISAQLSLGRSSTTGCSLRSGRNSPGWNAPGTTSRTAGRGYYPGLCFHIHAVTPSGEKLELADGGALDWTQKYLGNAKERLVASGIASERVCSILN